MRAGVFCTAGYTETGGLQEFLRKLRGDVAWERCFPAVDKPAPKLGRTIAAPRREHAGASGERLAGAMLERLREHYSGDRCPFDFVLLADDADCRFAERPDEMAAWHAELARAVRSAVGHPLPVYVLLASPEVESWLLSDWEMGFGGQYHDIGIALRRHIGNCLLAGAGLTWDDLEDFGGRQVGGTCERKLSDALRDAIRAGGRCERCVPSAASAGADAPPTARLGYSKRHDGASMLKRIRPEQVRTRCSRYFAPAYAGLLGARAASG